MKFIITHLLAGLLLTSFFKFPNLVFASTPKQDKDACFRACEHGFRPLLLRMEEPNRNDHEWDSVKDYWSDCQYRCYRCAIRGANDGMEKMEWIFVHGQQNERGSVTFIAKNVDNILYSLNDCYQKWDLAIKASDITTVLTD
jgi:hypothetical protein